MSKKKVTTMNLGLNELQNGVTYGDNVLDAKHCPIPVDSLKVLVNGDSNDKFRVLSKKITTKDVKVVLVHRETGEKLKIVAPIEFLEGHNVPYKFPKSPDNHQIEGVLQEKVRAWTIDVIIKDLSKEFDLVVVIDQGSMKRIACKVPIEKIQDTKLYIDKCKTYAQAMNYDFDKINIWRESEWQKEIMTKINLLRLTQSTTLKKV